MFPGIGNVFNCGSVLGSPKRTNRCIQTEKIAGPIRDERDALQTRVKRLEEVGDQMAAWLNCERNLGNDTYTAHLWKQAKDSKP